MIDYRTYFQDKKITVVGLGLLGRGVGDVEFLASHGAELIVTDLKNAHELTPSIKKLERFTNIHYRLGEHSIEDFKNRDLVIFGAGVSLDSPYLAEARRHGIPMTMSTALCARFVHSIHVPILGVTGTRGKSTTTYLIAAILKQAGKRVLLGGNIQGVSTLALLPQVTSESVVVLELDSWQLQGFREEKLSPDIAVFTTFYPDHLNYYRGDMKVYLADKAEIFLHQHKNDTLILGHQAAKIVQLTYGDCMPAHVAVVSGENVPASWDIHLPGEHNKDNIACAIASARAFGISEEDIRIACEAFREVDGRLQFVRELRGIKLYNDTTATTPEATIAALRGLDPKGKKNIVLIMGGSDKGLDMSSLIAEIPLHCKALVFLAGSGTNSTHLSFPEVSIQQSLQAALAEALKVAKSGDIILFSPSFASFGMFQNEYDRGKQFMTLVENLA